MSNPRRPYELTGVSGEKFLLYGTDSPPPGLYDVQPQVAPLSRPRRWRGPKYDGTYNSILAALLYQPWYGTCLGNAFQYLFDRAGTWVSGNEIKRVAGSDGLTRVRNLRNPNSGGGYPIATRAVGKGVWDYMLILPPQPLTPRKRVIKRTRKRIIPRRNYDNGQEATPTSIPADARSQR